MIHHELSKVMMRAPSSTRSNAKPHLGVTWPKMKASTMTRTRVLLRPKIKRRPPAWVKILDENDDCDDDCDEFDKGDSVIPWAKKLEPGVWRSPSVATPELKEFDADELLNEMRQKASRRLEMKASTTSTASLRSPTGMKSHDDFDAKENEDEWNSMA